MSGVWDAVRDPILASAGGAAALLLRTAAKWIRIRMLAARVNKAARVEGGPAFGTVGWVWNRFEAEIGKVRSKGHATEAWCSSNAERIASLETAVFGGARLQSGEQERIDYQRERLPSRAAEADTEPEALPAFTADVSRARRRSRP